MFISETEVKNDNDTVSAKTNLQILHKVITLEDPDDTHPQLKQQRLDVPMVRHSFQAERIMLD